MRAKQLNMKHHRLLLLINLVLEILKQLFLDFQYCTKHTRTTSHCMSCMTDVRLADLKPIGTLGVGGFGRVELVKCLRAIPSKGQRLPDSYALKVMRKGKGVWGLTLCVCDTLYNLDHIVETSQEKHIFNERDILYTVDSRWVIKLYRTFRDKVYIFMLLEPCLGGELWTLLRNKVSFDEKWTKFYTACCVEALCECYCIGKTTKTVLISLFTFALNYLSRFETRKSGTRRIRLSETL